MMRNEVFLGRALSTFRAVKSSMHFFSYSSHTRLLTESQMQSLWRSFDCSPVQNTARKSCCHTPRFGIIPYVSVPVLLFQSLSLDYTTRHHLHLFWSSGVTAHLMFVAQRGQDFTLSYSHGVSSSQKASLADLEKVETTWNCMSPPARA